MKAYIVSLTHRGNAVRPKFGSFLWSNKYSRYVWRGELATSMGQLADLFVQASNFLRNQHNWFEELQAVEVDAPELGEATAPAAVAPEQPDNWESQKAALLDTIAELQETIRALSETSGRKKRLSELKPAC